MRESKGAYRVSVGKPEGRRPLERPRRRREDKNKTFSRSGMETWSGLIWLRISTDF
jgi:hypothetical protein